ADLIDFFTHARQHPPNPPVPDVRLRRMLMFWVVAAMVIGCQHRIHEEAVNARGANHVGQSARKPILPTYLGRTHVEEAPVVLRQFPIGIHQRPIASLRTSDAGALPDNESLHVVEHMSALAMGGFDATLNGIPTA